MDDRRKKSVISEAEIIALLKSKFALSNNIIRGNRDITKSEEQNIQTSQINLMPERMHPNFSNYNLLGIGDDAALIQINDQEALAISKDLLIEDSHFRLKYFSPQAVAHKAFHSNFSDLAAMGIKPQFALLGLALPPHIDLIWIQQFIDQIVKICDQYSVNLIGGDTVFTEAKLVISVTVQGIGKLKHIKYLDRAQASDIICVAGNLGHAHLGFCALEQNLTSFQDFKNKQLFPEAKINEGIYLGLHPEITSMTDISDGLSTNLQHLCKASKVGALVSINELNYNQNFNNLAKMLKINPLDAIINGGEDYGLLFTVKSSSIKDLSSQFYQKFGYNFCQIGIITSTHKIIYQ